jgi:protein-tyrosine-phosphatase
MAEGFARTYGRDVLQAFSAGLAPAMSVAPLTLKVMLEKNIDVGDVFPKSIEEISDEADLIVNMSGCELPTGPGVPVEVWEVRDPIGESEEVYRQVRDQIENRVMQLILAMRANNKAKPPARSEVDTQRRRFRQ